MTCALLKKPTYSALQKQLAKYKKQLRAHRRKEKTTAPRPTEPATIELKDVHHLRRTVAVDSISHLHADGNTTNVYVAIKNRLLAYYISCNLRHALQKLPKQKFIRSHFSFAANVSFIKTVLREKNTKLQMLYDAEVPVAKRRKSRVMRFIKKFFRK
ncbi:MAG: LytTR family transcriptional regulator [Sphingobacteriales bacterium]|nr:MAG: LytTR family transcriptional regulator [Sphingobacteriales bacterium]